MKYIKIIPMSLLAFSFANNTYAADEAANELASVLAGLTLTAEQSEALTNLSSGVGALLASDVLTEEQKELLIPNKDEFSYLLTEQVIVSIEDTAETLAQKFEGRVSEGSVHVSMAEGLKDTPALDAFVDMVHRNPDITKIGFSDSKGADRLSFMLKLVGKRPQAARDRSLLMQYASVVISVDRESNDVRQSGRLVSENYEYLI